MASPRRTLAAGDEHTIRHTFTATDVAHYAALTGDHNPIHVAAAAAKAAGFPACIVHGMLVAGLFSQLLGQHLPGPQSVYMQQSLKFIRPVFVGQEVTATVRILDYDPAKGNAWVATTVSNKDGKVCVTGTALGRNKVVEFAQRPAELGAVPTVGPASAAEKVMPRGIPVPASKL